MHARPGIPPSLLGLVLSALFLVSCGDPRVASESEPSADPPVEPLVILTWDEYFAPEVVAAFEEAHGIPVEFVTFSNLDEMDGLLRSRPTDFDLLVASGGTVADLIELDLVQPIDRSLLPGFVHFDDRFLGLHFDPENRYSVPYMWGTTLIAYRSDKISEPAGSWTALWDEAHKNRVLMLDDGFDVFAAALLADGRDLNSQDPAELEAATARLLDQAGRLGSRFVDVFEVRDKLLSGECWIGMTYSSDAAVLAEEEENIAYFIPQEGAPLWLDSFMIPRESTNQEAAHLFLDHLCQPEIAAANSNALWSASTNRSARAFLSKEILEDPTLYLDEETMARCRHEAQTEPERQRAVNQGLKKVFDKVREQEAKPRISLLIWEDYLMPEAVARFEREHGAKLVVTEVANSEQLKQALASRPAEFDLVVADEQTIRSLDDLRLLGDLDPALLKAAPKKTEEFLSPAAAGASRSVPYLWGLTVLAGRPEILRDLEPSWNLLWREDLRIALLDEPTDLVWLALLSLGHDPATATKEQIDEAATLIARRFPKLVEHMKELNSGLDALEAGEFDLIVTYSGDALARASRNAGIDVVLPKEGALLWVDSFALTRNASSPELAQEFIRFMTSPEVSARTTETLFYASPNPEARRKLAPSLQGHPVLYPPEPTMSQCRFVHFGPNAERHVHQALLRIISGNRSNGMTGFPERAVVLAHPALLFPEIRLVH